jgi:F420H(2)-dependent quinone reductase
VRSGNDAWKGAHAKTCDAIERHAFHTLNQFVAPLVRGGMGSSRLLPAGLTVLETTGRISGKKHQTPLLALSLGDSLLVSTWRGRGSQWLDNVAKEPNVRYWLDGQAYPARATLVAPGGAPDVDDLGASGQLLAAHLSPLVAAGWRFAVLRDSARTRGIGRPKRALR